ncbi:MAG TPA: hypothetical protein VHD14_00850 [Pseudolabrys sp.]|nr:hypothetical protein [Pseudolabrys sp.]
MRYVMTAAAALATCGFFALTAQAEPAHSLGGVVREGSMCWVSTHSDLGYGYWKACETKVRTTHHAKKMKSSG